VSYLKLSTGVGLGFVSYVLFYILSWYIATTLGDPTEFGDYSVTIAVIAFFSSFALIGSNKLALEVLPQYIAKHEYGIAHGFIRRGIQWCLSGTIILVIVAALTYEGYKLVSDPMHHHPILVGILFTPIISLALFFVEVINAVGYYIISSIIYRVGLPIFIFGIIVLVGLSGAGVTDTSAVVATGIGWSILAFVLLLAFGLKHIRHIIKATPEYITSTWINKGIPFWATQIAYYGINSVGVILLELIHPEEDTVGIFSIALQTASFFILFTTSSNRYLLPMISASLQDKEQVSTILRKRRDFIICAGLAFFALMILWGKPILGLFGTEYQQAYIAMILLTFAYIGQTLYGIVPYLLIYCGHKAYTLRILGILLLLTAVLTSALIPFLHVMGAALGFALAVLVVCIYQEMVLRKLTGFRILF